MSGGSLLDEMRLFLRAKINACVRKPNNAVPDEDAPDDPHSVRYWATVKQKVTESDTSKQQLESRIAVTGSPEMANALMAPVMGTSLSSSATPAEVARAGRDAEAALMVFQGLKASNNGAGGSSALYVFYPDKRHCIIGCPTD